MKRPSTKWITVILALFLVFPPTVENSYAARQSPGDATAFRSDELDQILAPVALYPDPILAQVLPAASFGDQITLAQQLLDGRVDEGLIERQNWDVSVKAIAHYPSVLEKMAQDPDWTAALGRAYVTQERDVETAIQRLRAQARRTGALQSTPQQEVIVEPNVIRIEPAQPQVIYVPQYDPALVWGYSDIYINPAWTAGLIGFGSGFVIGSWLNRDWDWYGAGPYYHGWSGRGWIGVNRGFVNTHNHFYVNDQFRHIDVNRNVVNRNISGYRGRLDHDNVIRRKPGNGVYRHEIPSPGVSGRGVPGAMPPSGRERPRSVTPAPGGRMPHAGSRPQGGSIHRGTAPHGTVRPGGARPRGRGFGGGGHGGGGHRGGGGRGSGGGHGGSGGHRGHR
jgi:uncharacterized membrane protein YgcG